MLKKITKYIAMMQDKAKNPLTEEELLLGTKKNKIINFFTSKDLHKNLDHTLSHVKEKLEKIKGSLIINGNLPQPTINQLMNLALKTKNHFSVVVYDGYRLWKSKKFEGSHSLALIVVKKNERTSV